jgi:hypothetical protein
LKSKIKQQNLKYIVFSYKNSFFETNSDFGFIVSQSNKSMTGHFKYRLFLPQANDKFDEDNEKLKLITSKAIRIHLYIENCGYRMAYAPISDDKTLLLSSSNFQAN